MSVYSCKPPLENICSRDVGSFYIGALNNLLQAARCLGLVKCFQIIILVEIYGNSAIFTISVLPPIALKYCNFQDNLEFKGEVVTNFLLRSHFLSIYNNMTKKQKLNHGAIQWYFSFQKGYTLKVFDDFKSKQKSV